ncbi:hypothetical protein C5167_044072 [Papaver somniferum]|uniref:Uncharacterized protein n=1 Tax=Papaver somniferum TaxID=3469 RepID=A0A4Y7L8E8_PAPSO|nr:hypothetical protein C5167_044072 [Papaver somniferum]
MVVVVGDCLPDANIQMMAVELIPKVSTYQDPPVSGGGGYEKVVVVGGGDWWLLAAVVVDDSGGWRR